MSSRPRAARRSASAFPTAPRSISPPTRGWRSANTRSRRAAATNGALFHLIDGTFSFVAGQVAHSGGLKIETPVATVGIRGTTGWVQQVATVSATVGNVTYSFAVVNDQNTDRSGFYDLIDQYGNVFQTVSEKGILTMVTGQGAGQPPSVTTQPMTDAQLAFEQQIIQAVFNLALRAHAPVRPRPRRQPYQPPPTFEQHNENNARAIITTTFALDGARTWTTTRSSSLRRWCGHRRSCRCSRRRRSRSPAAAPTSGGARSAATGPLRGNWTQGVPGPPQVVIMRSPAGRDGPLRWRRHASIHHHR